MLAQACLLPLQPLSVAAPKLGQDLFLPVRDGPFSAPRRLRFWCVFGPFARAVPLHLAILRGSLWVLVFLLCQACLRLTVWPYSLRPWQVTGFRRTVFGPQPAPFRAAGAGREPKFGGVGGTRAVKVSNPGESTVWSPKGLMRSMLKRRTALTRTTMKSVGFGRFLPFSCVCARQATGESFLTAQGRGP